MIITRTPFRITLGGGGTDLPSYYSQQGGYVFSMAINKYMYIMLNRRSVADRKIVIRYSQVETVDSIDDIRHPLAREALRLHDLRENIELTSIADMPGKSGLGSSGSYLVGLLTAIRAYKCNSCPPATLAEEACHIEMDILKEPVGKQDQYMAAFGGFQELEIAQDGKVEVREVPVDPASIRELVGKAGMYYTGVQRSATAVLKDQDEAARRADSPDHARVMDCLSHIKEIGRQIRAAFAQGDMDAFGRLMDAHWMYKKQMSRGISLSALEELYEAVKRDYGVLGGKIIGAGGGGFIFLYCPERTRELDAFMAAQGMPRVEYQPSTQGALILNNTME